MVRITFKLITLVFIALAIGLFYVAQAQAFDKIVSAIPTEAESCEDIEISLSSDGITYNIYNLYKNGVLVAYGWDYEELPTLMKLCGLESEGSQAFSLNYPNPHEPLLYLAPGTYELMVYQGCSQYDPGYNYNVIQAECPYTSTFFTITGSMNTDDMNTAFKNFLGTTTPATIIGDVTKGVRDTSKPIWPIFAFTGVPLTFVIGRSLVWFIRRSTL
jgi:hypothetical protein